MVSRYAYGWILLCALLSLPAHGKELIAHVSQQTVHEHDEFQLILTYPDATQQGDPDFRALEQDFVIVRRQRASSTQFIQGQRQATTQWQLTLRAKRTGELTLPAMTFAGHRSQPITITSKPVPAHVRQQLEHDFFFHVDISKPPYKVHGQLLYTERVYYARQHLQPSLSELKVDNARIQLLGEPRHYATDVDNRRYQVYERRYAIFPERSGPLTIPSQTFQAQIVDNNNGWGRRQPIRIDSKAIELTIAGIPSEYPDSTWLPAQSFTISEHFSQDTDHWRVGEPLTRTITLRAQGLAANQLPTLPSIDLAHIRQYPDQAVFNERTNDQGIVSEVQLAVALVPNEHGDIELPEISLPWWDLNSQQVRYAQLPARTLQIQPSAAQANNQHNTASNPPSQPNHDTTDGVYLSERLVAFWLIVTALLLVLIAYLLWARTSPRQKTTHRSNANDHSKRANTIAAAWQQLQDACKRNDAQAIRQRLIDWANLQHPPHHGKSHTFTSVLDVQQQLGNEQTQPLLQAVDASLYAPHTVTVDGQQLWRALQSLRQSKKRTREHPLKSLYPG